jgi:hypothetical protein
MTKRYVCTWLFIVALVLVGASPALAADIEVSGNTAMTANAEYDRNPSVIYDGSDYWLFWTKGDDTSTSGVRGGSYNPDADTYVVYYKTAGTLAGLAAASETQLALSQTSRPAGFDQRVVSATYYGGKVYAFVSSGQSGTDRGLYYYDWNGSTWSGPTTLIADATARGGHVNVTSDASSIYLVWEASADASSDCYTWDGVTLSSKIDISNDNQPKINLMGTTLYVTSIEDGTTDIEVYSAPAGASPSFSSHSTAIAGGGFYDPCIFNDGTDLYIVSAPYVPADRQYMVQTQYTGSWAATKTISYGGYGTTEWWDYWPCGFYDGSSLWVFFTTETASPVFSDGEIAAIEMDWDLGNDHYFYIKNAVAQATSGDVVNVAPGTYVEGLITIDKNLSLIGDAGTRPVLNPLENTDHATHRGWFQATGSTVVDIKNFVFDGTGKTIENCIRYQEGPTGTVENCDISNIDYSTYVAFGIVAVDYTAYGGGSPLDLSPDMYIKDCTLSNIKRVGISVFGVDRVYVQNLSYTGKGDGDWLDYAVEVGGGGYGIVEDGCEISGCTGMALSDSSSSAGILVSEYFGDPSIAQIDDCDIHDNTSGVYVGYGTTDASTVTITDNDIHDNDYGISTASSPGMTITATGNEIHDNAVIGLENDCDNLVAYSNKFYGNGQNAQDDGAAANQWNYSSCPGNYWDDFLSNSGYPTTYDVPGAAASADDCPLDIAVTLTPATALLDCGDPITFEVEVDEFALDLMGANYKINYDNTKLTFVSAVVGGLLNTGSGEYIFTYQNLGGGVIIVNSAHLGTGVDGPGVIAEISFNALASTIPGTTPVTFSDAELRNSTNQVLPTDWTGADITIDCTDPTITVTLDAPTVPWTCYNTAPTVDIGATDDYDLDCVKYNIDLGAGGPWTDIVCGLSGTSYTQNDWTLPGFAGLSQGSHTYYFLATDDAGNSSVVQSVTFIKDTVKPAAVTGLTSNVGHNQITLAWTNPGSDVDRIYVYRNDWTDYPEYATTDPGYPTTGTYDWTVDAGNVGTYVDASFSNTTRGVYAYRAVVYDCAGNWADPTAPYESDHDRSTSYYLGDIASSAGSWGPNYDGLVSPFDYNPFSGCYWQSPPAGSCNEADFGPTIEPMRGQFGIPVPDDYIGFEDLMIFAMNYGNVSKTDEAPVVAVHLSSHGLSQSATGFTVAVSGGAADEDIVRMNLVVLGNDVFKGLSAEVEYDHSTLELVSVAPAEDLVSGDAPVLFMGDEVDGAVKVDLAVLGNGIGIGGSGAVATMIFHRTGSGEATVNITQAEARDVENASLTPSFDDGPAVLADRGTPRVFALRANTPNPFSTSTVIHYDIPKTSSVTVKIYNIRGQVVRTLVAGVRAAGTYAQSWDARDSNGQMVSPGIYFCELRSADFASTHKMLITR